MTYNPYKRKTFNRVFEKKTKKLFETRSPSSDLLKSGINNVRNRHFVFVRVASLLKYPPHREHSIKVTEKTNKPPSYSNEA